MRLDLFQWLIPKKKLKKPWTQQVSLLKKLKRTWVNPYEKYDVYGIGNALVDTEFEVTEDFLKEQKIEKGCMSLLDAEGHQSLSKILRQEFEVKKQSGGGSAGNSMYSLTQFGGKAFYSCKVASDSVGEYFLSELGHNNIETSSQEKTPGTSGPVLNNGNSGCGTNHEHLSWCIR